VTTRRGRAAAACVLAALLAACGRGAPPRPAAASPAVTATATPAAPPATASATVARPCAAPGQPAPPVTWRVIGSGFGQPDDVTVAADGTIYFTDFAGGRVGRLPPGGGRPVPVASGLADPEGVAVLPDGSLAVVEQARNRILRLDPTTGRAAPLADLANATGLEGVDGIAWDGEAGDLLLPDSPHGRLLRLDPATGRLRVLVPSGLGRPTGAAPLPGGGAVVVDETGGRVLRLGPDGRLAPLAALPRPDDAVRAPDGAVFVNDLAGSVWEVTPVCRVLLAGLQNPQGLALGPDGSLVVVESGRNRLLRLGR
jgi:sugar lactone lactonase YvrE